MKKFLALLLAAMMVLGSFSAVYAEDPAPEYIKLAATDTHTYKVFQVLTGTLASEGSSNLGNPAWGADVKADVKTAKTAQAFIDEIKDLTGKALADAVEAVVDTTGNGRGTVTKDTPITGLAKGYYVLVDVTTPLGKNDTRALNVVQVLNNIESLTIKHDTTSDEKIIATDTLGNDTGTNTINGDTDNVSVGDTVSYQIKAEIPAKASDYNYFYFIVNDTLDESLTFSDNIEVYVDSVAPGNKLTLGNVAVGEDGKKVVTGDYLVKTGNDADPYTFQVAMLDAKARAGHSIYVTYSAVLNEKAVIGDPGNKNTEKVKFSNNPNDDYDGDNYPGFPATNEDGAFGETPEKTTITYSTGIEIQKVDQDGKVLTGATFEISGQSTKTVLTVEETFTVDNTNGIYYKLKDGTYTKTAPTTTGEYMVRTPGATAGYVIDSAYTGEDAKEVDGVTYRPYAPATDAGKDVYVLTTGNGHLYDGTDKYTKALSKSSVDAKTNHKASMEVNTNGLARFDGLGAGDYTIKETVTPQGYNTLPDLEFNVAFSASGTPKFTVTSKNANTDVSGWVFDDGVFKLTIENNQGTQLPSTGGTGTYMIYAIGAILVLLAGILLVSKRRAA